ncbi:MAG: tail fiber domain-containing protein [Magnetococcales bacterium]|nr:tail fiber domain-containing protein [Magnetococcales bacterium]
MGSVTGSGVAVVFTSATGGSYGAMTEMKIYGIAAFNSDAIICTDDGKVGIGVTSPSARLDVNVGVDELAFKAVRSGTTTTDLIASFHSDVGGSGTVKQEFTVGGDIYIPAGKTYGNRSDRKLKDNIQDATQKLPDLLRLRVRNFNTLIEPDNKVIDFIAQEFAEVFPSLVVDLPDPVAYQDVPDPDWTPGEGQSENDRPLKSVEVKTTTKAIKMTPMIPILVKALQEECFIRSALEANVEALKMRLDILEGKQS